MSQYIIIINSALLFTSIFLFNYSKQNNLNFFIHKIKNLEQDIQEIHITLDTMEEKIYILKKQICILENNITNNIDNFITSNYDII